MTQVWVGHSDVLKSRSSLGWHSLHHQWHQLPQLAASLQEEGPERQNANGCPGTGTLWHSNDTSFKTQQSPWAGSSESFEIMKRPPIILDSIYILSGISSPFVYGLPSNVWSPASPPSAAQWASYPSRVFPARSSLRASPETASGARRWRFCLDDLASDVYIIYIYIWL